MNKPIHHGRTSRYQEVYSIESDSRPGIMYTVALSYKGTWSCGCPRWTRNAERPECKHIKFMKSYVANAREAAATIQAMPEKVLKALSRFAAIELD